MEKYKNSKLDIETRVNDLLRRMTVDEKIDQMYTIGCNQLHEMLADMESGRLSTISATYQVAGFDVDVYNRMQEIQLKNSRLGIPFVLHGENLHGVRHPMCTVFPTSGCMAATFNEKLAGQVADIEAKEARALGITQLYAPNLDITWDPRWGRTEENFGEDPYLTAKMGVEIVKNIQKNKVAATVKHYLAYGLGESGLNLAPAHIGEREVREYMLYPFAEAIKKGKAWGVMPSYNEVDGVPVHASKLWMKDVLRDELGFDGMIVTDYGVSGMFVYNHHIADTAGEVGQILCDCEVDMEACGNFGYGPEFRELVRSGKYPISKVNQCVKNILRLKFRLGLFENPFIDKGDMKKIHSKKAISLARKVAEQGIVLLKNDGTLPLSKGKRVAVIGPNADVAQLGNYVAYDYNETCYEGRYSAEESLTLKQVFERSGEDFVYAKGCDYHVTDEQMLEEARAAARDSDVVILALGDNSKDGACGGKQEELILAGATNKAVTSGEGYDMHFLELTDAQRKLFDEIVKLGKPVITLIYGGRPHALIDESERSAALLFAFAPGEEGNPAIFDILYGDVNPSGKLPISFPRSTGHIPCFYNHKHMAKGFYKMPGSLDRPGRDYVLDTPDALFPFGFGLSYTRFAYSNIRAEKQSRYKYKIYVDVENVGERDGDESVLLFLSATTQRGVTPIIKKLRGFKRISLKAGEKKQVEFCLNKEDFSYVDYDCKTRAARTVFGVTVGDCVMGISTKE